MQKETYIVTAESVGAGHPDKASDRIADSILDACLTEDPNSRVAVELCTGKGVIFVSGEVTTKAVLDVDAIVRKALKDIGYNDPKFGCDYKTVGIVNNLAKQSPDIAQGVDVGGAGDQGIMFGYATNETKEYMPLPITLANRMMKLMHEKRESGDIKFIGPDSKSQVSIEYNKRTGEKKVTCVVISTQHTEEVIDPKTNNVSEEFKKEIVEKVIKPVLDEYHFALPEKILINPTGRFLIGGPAADAGVVGRKIVVDSYGGAAPVGGGAFSGKDPTKVDRSAAYAARSLAKHVVAAGLASECLIQLSYSIGVAEPTSLFVDTKGTGVVPDAEIADYLLKNMPVTPKAILEYYDLRKPIYAPTAAYGHFGREEFPWEKINPEWITALRKQFSAGDTAAEVLEKADGESAEVVAKDLIKPFLASPKEALEALKAKYADYKPYVEALKNEYLKVLADPTAANHFDKLVEKYLA